MPRRRNPGALSSSQNIIKRSARISALCAARQIFTVIADTNVMIPKQIEVEICINTIGFTNVFASKIVRPCLTANTNVTSTTWTIIVIDARQSDRVAIIKIAGL
ncbi:hypothetical protein D3C71_1650310 [compost metagenome]